MTQHPPERITPLPWKIENDLSQILDSTGSQIALICGHKASLEQDEIHAAYIVHACNNYPKLEALNSEFLHFVESFIKLEQMLVNGELKFFDEAIAKQKALSMAKALIAKAKGGV